MAEEKNEQITLEGGTYEILKKRLEEQGERLNGSLNSLNQDRQETFGSVSAQLLSTQRITTEHNCTPRDIVAIGDVFIFAYNVTFGLKSTTEVKDVFSIYRLNDQEFEEQGLSILDDSEFLKDFENLYKYYKQTIFARFWISGPNLFMIFQIGKSGSDIKTFKWLMKPDGSLEYLDNRSDHEYKFPKQQEFEWTRTNRDYFREGRHPHVSIHDRVFVECIGGDLTIKIEDNTESGEGIYGEQVDHKEQKLDDADIQFTELGPLILLRIKPYREDNFRYFVFNEKIKQVVRVDSIGESCILLPDDHGLIFPNGYYLISGEYKKFNYNPDDLMFERRIVSPNGEDSMYVFYQSETGHYVLLSYNVISRSIATPIQCNGHCFFRQGELLYFRSEDSPQKHHTVQIWQTPFVSPDYKPPVVEGSFLAKIGNKELVRCMAECQSIINLIRREEIYQNLYDDILDTTQDLLDAYFWLSHEEAHGLASVLSDIRETASAAIDEFDKVREIKRSTQDEVHEVEKHTKKLLSQHKPDLLTSTNEFVSALYEFRKLRGRLVNLRELRYVDNDVVDELESLSKERIEALSTHCVDFLLKPEALDSYHEMVSQVTQETEELAKASDAEEIQKSVTQISNEIETLIDVVGNLRIDDATKSTQIIDGCSGILTNLNTVRADLRNRKKSLQSKEAVAEFTAQMKLLEQSILSYLDISDSPEKCDENENRLMVQVEDLEGRFADFDEYVIKLSEKRSEIASAFESKKLALVEEKNRRIDSIAKSADRILNAVKSRVDSLKEITEINAYFAGDLMVDKVRNLVHQLIELGDTVKSDEVESRLKSVQENAIRQLKDRHELSADGDHLIRFGKHVFSVNRQKTEMSFLVRENKMNVHITGTNFFEPINDEELNRLKPYWAREYISENQQVYRSEYLAYLMLTEAGMKSLPSLDGLAGYTREKLLETVQKFMSPRFDEGYQKGVHDIDATRILAALLNLRGEADLLRFEPQSRSLARLFWYRGLKENNKDGYIYLLKGMGEAVKRFGELSEFRLAKDRLRAEMEQFNRMHSFYAEEYVTDAASYLFEEVALRESMIISSEAAQLHDEFIQHLTEIHQSDALDKTLNTLKDDVQGGFQLLRGWLSGFLHHSENDHLLRFVDEAAAIITTGTFNRSSVHAVELIQNLEGMKGMHPVISDGVLKLDFSEFMGRLSRFLEYDLPKYRRYSERKKYLAEHYREDLRLKEFEPRVLTSFVRNKLINDVYLPMIGDNLAKQIGVAGSDKRTDLMGLLLLISPPGYGKTTLMEYIASRLGVIFVKVNGPSIGHAVTSLDPLDAPNAAAKEEIEKLNFALEMGDNIMIYLDDIQHCNPEFLQKFISLCDGQRRIEGIWRGRSQTYDLRGRKVAVVMAGNPYTESGGKFQIPDMLANRADTYNLGDILGDYNEAFEQSYIENCLTSNPILAPLSHKSQKDIYKLIALAKGRSQADIGFEGSYSASEMSDYTNVLKKLFRVRDVILRVNEEYIRSAAQEDLYRTEPPFKLQGSYRNMNRLAEKVLPVMNDEELTSLILAHYQGESQTLTKGAEANLLKFKELTGLISEQEKDRWEEIKETFQKKQKMLGMQDGDSMAQALLELNSLSENIHAISSKLAGLENLSASVAALAPTATQELKPIFEKIESSLAQLNEFRAGRASEELPFPQELKDSLDQIARNITSMKGSAAQSQLTFSEDTLHAIESTLNNLRLTASFPDLESTLNAIQKGELPDQRGEFIEVGSMRACFESNGYTVEETGKGIFRLSGVTDRTMDLRVRNDRLEIRMPLTISKEKLNEAAILSDMLTLNSEILPVSFALEKDVNETSRLILVETRDGKNLTRNELVRILEFMEAAGRKAARFIGHL